MNISTKYTALLLGGIVAFASCKKDKDDPVPPTVNEEELITTLVLHFHSAGGSEHKHFRFSDLDGDGGNAPVITADTLSQDSIYHVGIMVLNESATPVEDITAEILAEGTVHQFFFHANGGDATVAYDDLDANGSPIGLNTTWTIGAPGNGTITVTLRHGPDKNGAGVSGGDITNAGGETDIEVTFPLFIE